MPKSKVRKKADAPLRPTQASVGKALAPSPTWYPIVAVVILLIGLAYLILYYMTNAGTDPSIPMMDSIGAWNFAVGFGVGLVGLIMLVRWR